MRKSLSQLGCGLLLAGFGAARAGQAPESLSVVRKEPLPSDLRRVRAFGNTLQESSTGGVLQGKTLWSNFSFLPRVSAMGKARLTDFSALELLLLGNPVLPDTETGEALAQVAYCALGKRLPGAEETQIGQIITRFGLYTEPGLRIAPRAAVSGKVRLQIFAGVDAKTPPSEANRIGDYTFASDYPVKMATYALTLPQPLRITDSSGKIGILLTRVETRPRSGMLWNLYGATAGPNGTWELRNGDLKTARHKVGLPPEMLAKAGVRSVPEADARPLQRNPFLEVRGLGNTDGMRELMQTAAALKTEGTPLRNAQGKIRPITGLVGRQTVKPVKVILPPPSPRKDP